jgi:hypothetical protein
VTLNGVFVVVMGGLVVLPVAMHTNVLPASCGTPVGHTTVTCRWRSERTLCSIEAATRAVFNTGAVVEVEVDDEEPQALNRAVHASAVIATKAPRRARTTVRVLEVDGLMCMRAY